MHLWIGSRFKRPALYALSSVLLLLASTLGIGAQTRNWWSVTVDREDSEKGKLQDLATRKRVYVTVTFSDTRPNSPLNNPEQNDILESVKEAISVQKDLKIVTFPEEAEFAVMCVYPQVRETAIAVLIFR